jgi:hypothetical protein
MKTIEIQKRTNIKDVLDVFVNGEKHVMRHQSLKINISDNKHFEIKVRQLFDGSPVYTFEPKDNMLLQISLNWQILYWALFIFVAAATLIFVIEYFFGKEGMSFFSLLFLVGMFLVFIIRWKKSFIIREVENNE